MSYTVVGCTHRDFVLLKSVITLYGTQGNVTWDYRRSLEVDLVIIGTETAPASVAALLRSKGDREQIFLWISDAPLLPDPRQHLIRCHSPLHAYQLAGQLKQVENFFRGKLSLQQVQQRQVSQQHVVGNAFPEDMRITLLRWPPPEMLSGNKSFWRIAAMLSARSMTLAELAEHSAQPRSVCKEFLYSLHHAGYAKIIDAEKVEAVPPPPAYSSPSLSRDTDTLKGLKGLLRRIRVGLGFSSA
ncbi:MAG: hypothetical protein LBO79_05150 [Zoogloeaceae bacterium]|nr:hypothetical protein [Zoogloeaceae bacterium]